jgi:hypothetical protein
VAKSVQRVLGRAPHRADDPKSVVVLGALHLDAARKRLAEDMARAAKAARAALKAEADRLARVEANRKATEEAARKAWEEPVIKPTPTAAPKPAPAAPKPATSVVRASGSGSGIDKAEVIEGIVKAAAVAIPIILQIAANRSKKKRKGWF